MKELPDMPPVPTEQELQEWEEAVDYRIKQYLAEHPTDERLGFKSL